MRATSAACAANLRARPVIIAARAALQNRSAAGKLRIAMIPKGTTHEFWKSVHAGAVKASRELDVEVVWKGPLKEDDLKSQIDLVQSFTAQKVSGIALAPLNDRALVASVDAAAGAGVPVVIFDSALDGGNIVSFVATDNKAAGRLGGVEEGTADGARQNDGERQQAGGEDRGTAAAATVPQGKRGHGSFLERGDRTAFVVHRPGRGGRDPAAPLGVTGP